MNEIYDEWMAKDTAAQIREIKEDKEKEKTLEEEKLKKREKARTRKRLWKEWRKDAVRGENGQGVDDEDECEEESTGQDLHPGEAVGEPPGLGNSLHKAGVPPARLGGGEPGWGGGV